MWTLIVILCLNDADEEETTIIQSSHMSREENGGAGIYLIETFLAWQTSGPHRYIYIYIYFQHKISTLRWFVP